MLTRDLGYPELIGKIKNSFINDLLFKPVNENQKVRMIDSDKKWLKKYYQEDIEKLKSLIDCDLDGWLN